MLCLAHKNTKLFLVRPKKESPSKKNKKMLVETGEVHRHYDSDEEIEIEIINEDDEEAESSHYSNSKPKQDEKTGNND